MSEPDGLQLIFGGPFCLFAGTLGVVGASPGISSPFSHTVLVSAGMGNGDEDDTDAAGDECHCTDENESGERDHGGFVGLGKRNSGDQGLQVGSPVIPAGAMSGVEEV